MINNCYKCIHRGTVPGDTHSCCNHPDLKGLDLVTAIMDMIDNKGTVQSVADKFQIKANPHGIKMGWFLWPINFDPIWLENCNGFEQK